MFDVKNTVSGALDNLGASKRYGALGAKGKKATPEEIAKVAQEFESVFLSQMLQQMFTEVDMDPMSEDGAQKDVYKSFMLDEYAKIISRSGGIGVADHVKREMLRLQEVAV